MKKAYYARPISIDGTPQAERDMEIIRSLGYEPWPVGDEKKDVLLAYKRIGMDAFLPYVVQSDALFFRAFPDGSIGAGVAQEIAWAFDGRIPVMEFPQKINRRTLSVDETRDMLSELGAR
jgi:hypothetical protein